MEAEATVSRAARPSLNQVSQAIRTTCHCMYMYMNIPVRDRTYERERETHTHMQLHVVEFCLTIIAQHQASLAVWNISDYMHTWEVEIEKERDRHALS